VPVGSVAIDGVSLTVAAVKEGRFAVAIIPYTFGNTTINALKKGSRVNLEFDILGKYIARQRKIEQDSASPSSSISDTWLREMGY
jgi:riboflavin synthase